MLLGRQPVALEERQNYSLGLRRKEKSPESSPFPHSISLQISTSLGECFVQEYLSWDWCVFACTCEGGKRGGMPLADNSGRFQPSYILLLCTFTYEHTQTHTAPGVIFISSSQWSQTSWIWLHLSFNSQVIRTWLHDYNTFQQTAVQYHNI